MQRSAQKIKIYRQGDVLLERVSSVPAGKRVKAESGRLILARGEVTGHHHSIPAQCGTLVRDEGGTTYLTIDQLTAVEHQEHAPIDLEPGDYRVTLQREWTDADEPRQVAD